MRTGTQSSQDEAELMALMRDEPTADAPAAITVADVVVDSARADAQPATTNEPDAEPSKPKGDVRAALRASRRSEDRLLREKAHLEEQLEAVKKLVPAQQPDGESLTDEELAQAEDFPLVAKLARQNKRLNEKIDTLQSQQIPSQPAAKEFQPIILPPEFQDVIDDIPDLLAWQQDPDQSAYQMVEIEDAKLLLHPKWKSKPLAERLAEAARRVAADLNEADPAPTKNRVNVDDAIASAPRVKPNTLGDIGGGGDIPKSASNLGRYSQMSDEDIEAELLSS